VLASSAVLGDGVPLIRTVRAFERVRGGRIATLALSADETARETALMAGFQEYLAKPIDAAEFCRVVARLVGSTRLWLGPLEADAPQRP